MVADQKDFLGFTDTAFKQFLINTFGPVLDNPADDVHWVPPEQAFGRRKQDYSVDDYTTPFIIFYRPDMHTLAKDDTRARLTRGNGIPFNLPSEDPKSDPPHMAKVIPQDVMWQVNYYTNDRDERDLFGTIWNEQVANHPLMELTFPINDQDVTTIEHTLTFADPDDLSDAEGWLSTGDTFRVEGETMTTAYTFKFQSDDDDPSVPPPRIEQVLLEMFADHTDDKYLVQSVYEAIDNISGDKLE